SALAGRTPESLSPGELQRVAFARALVRVRPGARLLLLDEPTPPLDARARAGLQGGAFRRARSRTRRGARLLLLDEPTAHLDDDARALVAEALLGLRRTVTMLLGTHAPLLAALADRTVDLPAPSAPQLSATRAGLSAPKVQAPVRAL